MTRTLDDLTWPVRTERLLIRRLRAEDAEAVWRYRRLPAVYDWITSAPPDEEAFRAYFSDAHRLAVTLAVEHEGAIIGDLYLSVEDAWAQTEVKEAARAVQAEIGWAFDPDQGGRGLATEAAAGMLGICFDGLGLRRVVASCFADNTPSWRLMERLGMRRESHARAESLHRSGRWLDGYSYAMLAEEWRAVRTTR
ncbi:MAG TPA: GNAT family protein [Propionibacteriaceae bacterium]|nr:GNAT family protein [Propionibacteriaceae bacterium]